MRAIRTLGTALLTCAVATASSAQTVTWDRDDHQSSSGARGIAVADFNRDGWIDVATANDNPDGVAVLLNTGVAGGFTATFIPLPGGPFDIVAADLNKDGLPDLAVANPDANLINVLFGRPAGGFSTPLNLGAKFNPRSLTIADMNRDGNPDIVYTMYYNRGVQILPGDGKGNFDLTMGAASVGPYPQGVFAGDLNADGIPDLAVTCTGSAGLTLLYQTSAGTFSTVSVDGPLSFNVIAAGDFDRNGYTDLATAATNGSYVAVYLNSRGSGPVFTRHYYVGSSPRGIAAADLNRDGALDLVTGDRGSSTFSVLFGDGAGAFGRLQSLAAGSGSRTVAAADFDNDGRIDLASGNQYASSVTVLSNRTAFPASAFAFARRYLGTESWMYSAGAVAVADFDSDGALDAATGGGDGRSVIVLRQNGSALTTLPALVAPQDIVAGQFNDDGAADVLFLDGDPAGSLTTVLKTFLGDGTGQFPKSAATRTGVAASDIQLADLNRDGRTDLVVSSSRVVQVYLANGDGSFRLVQSLAFDVNYMQASVGDINRDGWPDIVTYSRDESSSAHVEYRRNNGQGTSFSLAGSVPFTRWVTFVSVRLGDVNHDGYVDMVASGGYIHPMAVAQGSATGFEEPFFFDNGGMVYPFELADVTLDGHLDIINTAGQLMAGTGDGHFAAPLRFDLGVSTPRLEIVDFDRDGLPDLVYPADMGRAAVMIDQRNATNTPPVLSGPRDLTARYDDQFQDEGHGLFASATDAELHWVDYEWRDDTGQIVGTSAVLDLPALLPGTHEYTITVSDGRGGTASDTAVVTILPETEVVMHVGTRYPDTYGNWEAAADSSAAGGKRLHDPNLGAPKQTAPSSAPTSYATFNFIADPTQTYKLWVRLKADGNYWGNDSLWLQISGAVDAAGRAYEPGTTSGLAINLEECSGCGVSSWGWRDESWGAAGIIGSLTLRFPKGGPQVLRFQTREDGVSVDQVVLSAEKYRSTRPGAVKNDATIVPATLWWQR